MERSDELTFLPDEMKEYLKGDNRFKNTYLIYSLSYCQGDGLSFSCDEFSDEVSLNGFQNALNRKEINITNKLVYITNKY